MCESPEIILSKEAHLSRLSWRSRRGLLELDLLLPPFFSACYAELEDKHKTAYEALLTCEDPDILSWLNAHSVPEDEALKNIVWIIRNWNAGTK